MPNLCQKVVQTLKARIASGEISGQLPARGALETEFGISHATAQKVIDQLKLLGLVYSKAGKGVFVNKECIGTKGTVAVFLQLILLDIPFYMRFVASLQTFLREKGYEVITCSSLAETVSPNANWAVVIEKPHTEDSERILAGRFGKRIALINQMAGKMFSFNNNNFDLGFQAVECLYLHGHRKIGIVSREVCDPNGVFYPRLKGALEFAAQHPDVILTNEIMEGDEKIQSAKFLASQATQKLLDKVPDVTAIFAFTDVLAVGVLTELQRRGLRCPEDISIISVDNRSFAGFCDPPLTTFEEDAERMAELVAERINAHFQEGLPYGQSIRIGAKLVERSSVKTLFANKPQNP